MFDLDSEETVLVDRWGALELTTAPANFAELQKFYLGTFRPLYDRFMNSGAVAQEIHAEVAMAMDHFMCRADGDPDKIQGDELKKVCGHLKRATFDGFKLVFENEIRKPYDMFMDNKYADVHDGEFRREITAKWKEAQEISQEARHLEGRSRDGYNESWHAAFDEWNKLLPIAQYFSDLHTDPKVIRARNKTTIQRILSIVWQILLVILGALLLPIWNCVKGYF